MNKNTFITNPKTNNFIFGKIPEIKLPKGYFPAGDIMLLHGRHMGINKGFGVAHIWAGHSHELQKIGYANIDEVARYISDIIVTGAGLFSEFEDIRGNHKVAVIQGVIGTAILEQRINYDSQNFYSVITAFPKGKPRGTRIGSVAL
jgi:hypothetical protein